MKWIRTCQECGHADKYARPTPTDKTHDGLTDAYCNKPCKKCKSEALDYGSEAPETPAEIEAQRKYLESLEKLDDEQT